MGGINSVLDIAKEALLAHQLSVQVASHNVANVDTPGYSRQVLDLTNRSPVPTPVGQVGTGVKAELILRQYDQVLTQRIIDQNSTLSSFEAQEETLRVVEAVFNETQGVGLNDLMNEFWQSWQDLANNPENLAARQTVIQKGQLIQDHLSSVYDQVVQSRFDIGVRLDSAVKDINYITGQIADLNVEIATLEDPTRKANDLRDKRDEMVKELAQLLDITYFENGSNGSFSILLADGHTLVDASEANQIEWANGQLYWLDTLNSGKQLRVNIGDGQDLGGKVGGWLEVNGELVADDPDNFFGRLDSFASSLIREVNQLHARGTGTSRFSADLFGTNEAADSAVLTTTVDAASTTVDIPAGVLRINDREIGAIEGGAALNGLAMLKTANTAEAVNAALNSVNARMTTLVAGGPVTGLAGGETVSFSVNGIAVSYTAAGAETPTVTATNVTAAINAAIAAYNADPTTAPDMTIQAVVGDGTNGGAIDSIVLYNTNAGDESVITLSGIDPLDPAEAKLALVDGGYAADSTHNTGEITLFSAQEFSVSAGPDDTFLNHLGMGGGLHGDDRPNDGTFTYSFDNPGGVRSALLGYAYGEELVTDGGSFDLWLYSENGIPVLPKPITVNLDRVYDLQDVVDSINVAVTNASGGPAWLSAVIDDNRLLLRPADGIEFSFANDTSNILQVAGINTLFTGHDASSIGINQVVAENVAFLAAGTVDEDGMIHNGDNSNALALAGLQHDENVEFANGDVSTLDGFYNALVGDVGARVRTVGRNVELNTLLSNQLQDMRDSFSGVSLDEEMANLIKFQHAYSAAAKLITTADEMLLTLLNTLNR